MCGGDRFQYGPELTLEVAGEDVPILSTAITIPLFKRRKEGLNTTRQRRKDSASLSR